MNGTVTTLAEKVATQLEEKIIFMEYQPEDRLRENTLAEQLEVSRSTIREALLILQRRFLVNIEANKGASVTSITKNSSSGFGLLAKSILGCIIESIVQQPWSPEENNKLQKAVEHAKHAYKTQNRTDFYVHYFEYFDACLAFPAVHENIFLNRTLENIAPTMKRHFYYVLEAHPDHDISHMMNTLEKVHEHASVLDAKSACVYLNDMVDRHTQLIHSGLS